jgi:hypothetical protein
MFHFGIPSEQDIYAAIAQNHPQDLPKLGLPF